MAGVAVILPAIGASLELDISAPIPCFHAGAGAGLGASATGLVAVEHPCKPINEDASKAVANGMSLFITGLLIAFI